MLSVFDSTAAAQPVRSPARSRAGRGLAEPRGLGGGFVRSLVAVMAFSAALAQAPLAEAQDWGDDSNEDWSAQPAQAQPRSSSGSRSSRSSYTAANWSFQAGIGFTADPEAFLMNFDAPYAFNDWFSFGPALQVGIGDDRTIVSPTGNLRLTIPDLPGRDFDRVHPYAIAGMGFAVIDNDKNSRDNSSATGFLIDFGVGVEYQVSEKVFLGTQMIFNVLPDRVKKEHFYYAWQLGGIRFAF